MRGIDMVYVVGGNGGNAGADAIQRECEKQGVVATVIGIPKSIDNDILLVGTICCACPAGGVDRRCQPTLLCVCVCVLLPPVPQL